MSWKIVSNHTWKSKNQDSRCTQRIRQTGRQSSHPRLASRDLLKIKMTSGNKTQYIQGIVKAMMKMQGEWITTAMGMLMKTSWRIQIQNSRSQGSLGLTISHLISQASQAPIKTSKNSRISFKSMAKSHRLKPSNLTSLAPTRAKPLLVINQPKVACNLISTPEQLSQLPLQNQKS